jgi:predicted acyltransferase
MATAASTTIPEAPVAAPNRSRLLSLDVFRGATILAMILVNNPGEWGERSQYWPLDHAAWHGWTPTDLIFPFFLFIVGTSISYSFRKYRHGTQLDAAVYWRIIRRTATLIFLGWLPTLLLKSIAYFHEGTPIDLGNLRIFGVLVRIAIVYFIASLIVLNIPLRAQVVLSVIILLGYWATLGFLPKPHDYASNLSNKGNVTVIVDRALVGDKHMYHGDPPTEPEGFLSTFPAIVTSLLGYWTGLFIQRRGINYNTALRVAIYGFYLALAGQIWHIIFPINKKLWTSSFVLLTGGLAMVLLAACLVIFDIRGWRRLARPFEIVGVNAIVVFVASGLLAILLRDMRIEGISAHAWLYHHLVTSWIHDPKLASLGMALLTVAFWWFVCWLMSLVGLAIRV